jgi:TATA-box binding protein (TBP) (component of TFIID and TFIIIB)
VYLNSVFPHIDKLITTYNSPSSTCDEFINAVLGGKECFYPSRRTFMNSVIFTLKDGEIKQASKVAIKCFKNGSLHITGVRSIERAITIAQVICAFYELIHEEEHEAPSYTIKSFDVQLVNAHFSIDVADGNLRLQEMFHILLRESQHMCMYNNERHAGVIIKFLTESMRTLSIILFESGNVLICAFCDKAEYLEGWQYVTHFLNSHWEAIWSPVKLGSHSTKTKVLSSSGGFDYGKYIVL